MVRFIDVVHFFLHSSLIILLSFNNFVSVDNDIRNTKETQKPANARTHKSVLLLKKCKSLRFEITSRETNAMLQEEIK